MKHVTRVLMITSLVAFALNSAQAQKGKKDPKSDPKYTNYFQDVEDPLESNELTMEFSNAVARADMLKFKTKFINNTNDFLRIDPSEFTISMDGEEQHPNEKPFFLDPNEKKSRTIDLKGEKLLVDQFEVTPAGVSRISVDGKPISLPEFQLPATTNNIENGNIRVNLKRVSQETKQTWAVFEIKYIGDDYAIVDPSRISVKTENGEQFANIFRKSKTILLEKGESKSVDAVFQIPAKVVDMQFAKLMIQWGDAVIETKAQPIEIGESVTFDLDEVLTQEKNK